ncbi:hypothetical protein Y068_22970 [Salmonella enterica subsp. enterica serovar Infantis str. CVM N15228]|uniref:hypothetical protein n=1 Tax=Salmonella enterica TaxID=28901 RepID=UPI000972423C|nr:hypothetical protein [Salmonella enterica]OMJ43830.1 hypothetical protein Y068_22970 [Salmonella enterica subsp. enterica serovar Infantis str. CVM N15228]
MKIEHTTVMIDKSLDYAIMDLKIREKIKRTNDNFIAMLKGEKNIVSFEAAQEADFEMAEAIMNYDLTKKKENIIEHLINDYWSSREKSKFFISRIKNDSSKYLFGKNNKNEGFYLVWNNNAVRDLTKDIYQDIIKEGKHFNLSNKYHVFATGMLIGRKNITFYKTGNDIV